MPVISKHITKISLRNTFVELIKLNSFYPYDLVAQRYVLKRLEHPNIFLTTDDFGNVIARIDGDPAKEPLMLNSHFDIPEDTPEVLFSESENEVIATGKNILGADAKTGVAILIELALFLAKNNFKSLPTVEFVFTRGEEQGLNGAHALDLDIVRSRKGIILDQDGPVTEVVAKAPTYINLKGVFTGKTVHIREPEDGKNALQMAINSLHQVPFGYTDKSKKVTWNVGTLSGGAALNSVPAHVEFGADVRSFNDRLLDSELERILKLFTKTTQKLGGTFFSDYQKLCVAYEINKKSPLIKKLENAYAQMGLKPKYIETIGASDGNVFNARGIETVTIGSGYYDAHQYYERADLGDMQQIAKFLFKYLSI